MTVYTRLASQLAEQLREINARLQRIEDVIMSHNTEPSDIPESLLLSIPDHLRRSFMAVGKLGISTATDISLETGRARAVESSYLNQLVRMKHLEKGKDGREATFTVRDKQ
jgi:hypothetical protein